MENKKTIEDVISKAKEYLMLPKSLELIKDSYELAREKHEGQMRKSSDPYIQHPLEVAYMLAELHASPATIAAGFLHDILEDTDVTKEQLTEQFGTEVVSIVDGVTKISQLKYMTKEKALARTHQKILLAMAKDIRVVLVKLIDRVHNMRTLEFQSLEKQIKIAKETMDLYAPLAHRLGMYVIKAELEDLSFKYLNKEEFNIIFQKITDQRAVREEDIAKMHTKLDEILANNKIENYGISGRLKNIYSVYKKMHKKDLELDQIYDLMALRVMVNSVEDCYHVLGLIHSQWAPIPKRFKDYIATPKPNLYQSLHTTIIGASGKIYEVQIRTYEMDEIAEYGVAAHWAYKEDRGYSPEKEQVEISLKLKWYKDLLSYVEMNESEDSDPFDNIRDDIFSANVYVFTPKGDVFDFPPDATPLDFAYRVHTEVGNKTVGAIVNGKIVPLTYKLKTGDVVDIKTNKNYNGPNEAWLRIVKTNHARHKIVSVLNKQRRDALIERGKEEFERVCRVEGFGAIKIDDKLVQATFEKFNLNNIDDFYVEIGKGVLSARAAVNKISGKNDKFDEEALIKLYAVENQEKKKPRKTISEFGVVIDGLDRAQLKLAACCHPIYGDEIVGYVSKGHGIIVHRIECHNSKASEEERLIEVTWDPDFARRQYDSAVTIVSFDRKNIVAEIINMINTYAVTIKSISSSKNKEGDLLTRIKITVENVNILDNTITNLYKISDIYSIARVIK